MTTEARSVTPLPRGRRTDRVRIDGLDVARAIAVLGMFMQHFFSFGTNRLRLTDPSSWPLLVNNNSTVLFAVLAGVSKSLIDGGRCPLPGSWALRSRMNIASRALLLFAISGLLVTLVPTPGSVLGYIAAGFIISLPFLRLAPRTLLILGGFGLVLLPFPMHVLREVVYANTDQVSVDNSIDLLLTGLCPALIFLPLYLIGIALGRLDLRSIRVQSMLIGFGLAVAVGSYVAAALLTGLFGTVGGTAFSSNGHFVMPDWRLEFFIASPHINSVLQMTLGAGISLFVIGACLAVTTNRLAAAVLYPVRAVGMCAFTAYVLQFVAVAVFMEQDDYQVPEHFLIALVVAVLAVSSVSVALRGRGPLESVMTRWAAWFSRSGTVATR